MIPKMIRLIPLGPQAGTHSLNISPGDSEAQCRSTVWEVTA